MIINHVNHVIRFFVHVAIEVGAEYRNETHDRDASEIGILPRCTVDSNAASILRASLDDG
jgi:hypothetical protein